jgi:hypothetical protein
MDLNKSLTRARRILKWRWSRALTRLLLPVSAYSASIVTISLAWFSRSGSFKFDNTSWLDWIIAGVLLLILIAGAWQIWRELKLTRGITVNRDELSDLMTLARNDASQSVVNIAGDLTWLSEDSDTLLEIKRTYPSVEFKIYFERDAIADHLRPVVDRLSQHGIRFIPYPGNFKPGFQCMLIDADLPQDKRVLATWREGGKLTGMQRSEQKFFWKEYTAEHRLVPDAIRSIVDLIDLWPKRPVLVGFTGINNVGKTALATAVRTRLSKKCNPVMFFDPFREATSGVSLQDNFRMMIFQLLEYNANPEADVYIFDTTAAESLCYLALRGSPEGDQSYQQLAHACQDVMKRFDLVIEVQKDRDDIDNPTTYLTATDRRQIRDKLNEFYTRFGLVRDRVVIGSDHFQLSLDEQAEAISNRVLRLLDERNNRNV